MDILLREDSPKLTYKPKNKPGEKVNKDHIKNGQQKLYLMELLFLKKYGHLSDTIVYAGAAPGHHIPKLFKEFPNHRWILYDPETIVSMPMNKVIFIKEYFKKSDASLYKDKGYLFISDIRSLDPREGLKTEVNKANEAVKRDMEAQKEWVEEGRFIMSMLKFRTPWEDGQMEYFDGDLYYQPWSGEFSPELRLMTKGPLDGYKVYNYRDIDNKMFYHNSSRRREDNYDKRYEQYILNLKPEQP